MKAHVKTVVISVFSSLITVVLVSTVWVFADGNNQTYSVPQLIPYKGTLEKDGQPYNGTVDMTFSIYDADDSDSPVWSESQSVTVYNGNFSVMLGSTSSDSSNALKAVIDNADHLYIEVAVNGNVLSNRQEIVPVPYAFLTKTGNNLVVNGFQMRFTGAEFVMDNLPGRGDGGRALVHDANDTLHVNYAGDFAGGTWIDSYTKVGGDLEVTGNIDVDGSISLSGITDAIKSEESSDGHVLVLKGEGLGHVRIDDTDLMFGQYEGRGDGGRALVHGVDDSLILNYDNDFPGGVRLGNGARLNVKSFSQCDCEWVLVSGTDQIAACPDGKFVSKVDIDGGNPPYATLKRVYCCRVCEFGAQ